MKLSEFGRLGAVRSWLVVSASVFVLAACGGGDGTAAAPAPVASPPPPPPPPVSTNTAPVATILTDNATPDEGQPFMVDASSSTDPDNDNLTFMWTQTAGPDLEIADPTSPTQSFTAPELTETVTVTLEVEVSDGELVNTASVDVQLTNIFQMPRASEEFVEVASVEVGANPVFLDQSLVTGSFTVLGQTSNTIQVQTVTSDLSPVELSITTNFDPLELPDRVKIRDFASFGGILGRPITVIDEELDLVTFFEAGPTNQGTIAYQSIGSLTVENPCAANFLPNLVTSRNAGFLSFFANPTGAISLPGAASVGSIDPTDLQLTSAPNNFCALSSTNEMLNGDRVASRIGANIGVDSDTLTIGLIRNVDNGDGTFSDQIVETTPIDVDGIDGMQVVKTIDLETETTSPGMLILLSDGQHEGNHRLIFVALSADEGLDQVSYAWNKGVPSDAVVSNLNADNDLRVIVLTSTSPEAVVFAGGDNDDLSNLSGPTFFELGLGAGSFQVEEDFVTVSSGFVVNRDAGLLVAYPEQGAIRLFELQ